MIPTRESAWSYNGVLSVTYEWHLAVVGFVFGALLGISDTLRNDLRKDPQYLVGFALLGWLTAYCYDIYKQWTTSNELF